MSKLPFIVSVFFSFLGFSQQRVGLELFSHLDDLSLGAHFQKVVKTKFILGGGFVWINRRLGEAFSEEQSSSLSTAIRSVPVSFDRNGEKYVVQGYRTKSKAFMLTLNTGFFHEFGTVHGIRVNLNGRIGVAENKGTYHYSGQINDTIVPVKYTRNHLVTAVSPEIYHTLRQRQKLTFYYGLRFPVYFSLDKRYFDPVYRKDGFYGFEPEIAIGITYFVGKKL
ncbi:hypothetical protein [uncultured Fluviicola sp.]|uniref:hypothetical protein n=1 Tax=uncultured Fluviicola sp. TaxID=463303 RepID=UPI0025FD60F9|nr:hypothetical protein [uncultured Fluviicola sp.]